MSRIAIVGGTVVTAVESRPGAVLVEDEHVVAVAHPDSTLTADFARGADRVIDATGKLVVPGGIDVHTHLDSETGLAPVLDTFETGTIAAAFGGTTTIVDFASPQPGTRLLDGLERYHDKAGGRCAIDYGFHMNTFNVDEITMKELDVLMAEGVTSFKMFMAYPDRVMSSDRQILRVMQHCAENGGLVMMHAENGDAIELLREQAVARGQISPGYHAWTRPPVLEGEAVHRAAALAAVAGVPLYIVHLTSADALAELARAKARGQNVFAETCPQYLLLDETELERADGYGARFVCSPPLRPREHQDELWLGLQLDQLQVIATDHCPFCWEQKLLGADDFRLIPNGMPGVEHRMELLYDAAVAGGRLSVNRWVEICCTNPAKMFGLAPRKGTIAAGADADIVIFDPEGTRTISAATHHMNVDYSCYEGRVLRGRVETVLLRGTVIVEGDTFVGRVGHGQYLRRSLCGNLR